MSVGTGQLHIPTIPVLDHGEMILDMNKVCSDIKTTKEVVTLPFETTQVQILTKVKCHSKKMHVFTEAPIMDYLEDIMTGVSYTELKPGSSRVSVCIKKLTGKPVTLSSHTVAGTVTAANILSSMLAPKILVTEEANLDDAPLKEKYPSTEETCSHTGTDESIIH